MGGHTSHSNRYLTCPLQDPARRALSDTRMLSTLMVVSLVMTCGCSDVVRSPSEEADTNRTHTRRDNMVDADSGSDVKHRTTRSDVRAALGKQIDPGFWPARGRRSSSEDVQTPLWTNSERSRILNAHELLPYWRSGGVRQVKGRINLDQPLYAEEPHFVLLDRRDEPEESPEGSPNEDDLFWVTRGRRHYKIPFSSEYGQPFWASMRRLQDLAQNEKLFRASRSRRTENAFHESVETPFWPARGKRSSFKFVGLAHRPGFPNSLLGSGLCWSSRGRRSTTDDSRNIRGFLKSLSVEEPFWAARGKRSAWDENEDSPEIPRLLELISLNEPEWIMSGKRHPLHCAHKLENKRGLLESISAQEPFWVTRGKRSDGTVGDMPQKKGGLLDSLSADEPFWAARGRRGFLDSLSAEEPFWAARGKKETSQMASPSPEELLSQIRSRTIESKADPWWPVRGKRMVDTDSDTEDESFWQVLARRTQNNTTGTLLTS